MTDRVFNVAKDFSAYPGGRYRKDGPHSGEELRDILVTLLRDVSNSGDRLVIMLDGTMGYGASFLEEAFGGLVRECGYSKDQLQELMVLRADNSVYVPYKELAGRYILEAAEPANA